MKQGFDNEKYIRIQSEHIKERIAQFGNKLYMEFGGKLFDDYHASRVLPGFEPDSKVKMLLEMKDDAEIVIVLSADDIERSKRRGDLGITYDEDTLRLIDAFRGIGLYIGSVVITHFRGQPAAEKFTPIARPMIRAAMMMLRDFWKSVWFSTMLRIPIAEIMPYRIKETPPMVAVGITRMIAANFGQKESRIAK